ncbi:putative ribonuclease H-like domain-containing protein [Tanacetum coccineum]
MLVQVYVDDIIFGSTNKSWYDEFEALMKSRFQISSMDELTFFLGLQVKQNKGGIFISQDKYVAEIIKKFDLVNVKAAITPMETKLPLTKDEEAFDVDVTPKTSHLNAVKRIFKYLKGKPNLGLWYPRESPFDLEAFSDSDYGGSNLDRKSITGGCQFLGQRLISWQCKKQTIVATSTTEAEYVAAANCCGQVLWVQNQLLDYGFNFMNTKIHIDNESTICIVKNPVYHSKTKHIEIRHHFIRDCYEKKLISVEKIHTDLNVADLLTKPFDGPRFNYLVVSIGIAWMKGRSDKDSIEFTITEESVRRSNIQFAMLQGLHVEIDRVFEGLQNIGSNLKPSADPTPSHPVPTPTSSHVQITQPPPTVTHSVQPPPQPSSVQPTAKIPPYSTVQKTSHPPSLTIPDIQPTLPHISTYNHLHTMIQIQASRSSEESEQIRNLMDIVPRLESRVKSLEKELSETKQTLGTSNLAADRDQEVLLKQIKEDTFVTPEKSKGLGEAQEEQISPSTLEAAQALNKCSLEGFMGSQAPLVSKDLQMKFKSLQILLPKFLLVRTCFSSNEVQRRKESGANDERTFKLKFKHQRHQKSFKIKCQDSGFLLKDSNKKKGRIFVEGKSKVLTWTPMDAQRKF